MVIPPADGFPPCLRKCDGLPSTGLRMILHQRNQRQFRLRNIVVRPSGFQQGQVIYGNYANFIRS